MTDEDLEARMKRCFDEMTRINIEVLAMEAANPLLSTLQCQVGQKFDGHIARVSSAVPIFLPRDFEQTSSEFLQTHGKDLKQNESFYGGFTRIWGYYIGRYKMISNAEAIWELALQITQEAEKKTPDIHKGTPFYFYSVTCILGGELERGFLLMHAAMEEDKRTFGASYTSAPAHAFVTVDYSKADQFFVTEVKELAQFLDNAIHRYDIRHAKPILTLDQFKKKFLERKGADMQDIIFHFVYTLSRMKHLASELRKPFAKTDFGSLIEQQILFDLCQVSDCTIAELHSIKRDSTGSNYSFSERIDRLSATVPSLDLDKEKLGKINAHFKKDMSIALQDFIHGGFVMTASKPTKLQNDFAIAYGIRNFAAHNIEHSNVIYNNYEEISQRILNTIFFTVANSN